MPYITYEMQSDSFDGGAIPLSASLRYRSTCLTDITRKSVFENKNMIGVTSGGISFASNPEFVDFGEDMDNVPPCSITMFSGEFQAEKFSG